MSLFLGEEIISTYNLKKELMKGSIEDDSEVSRLGNIVDDELLSERKKENMKRTF